jgi:hypothetical protein
LIIFPSLINGGVLLNRLCTFGRKRGTSSDGRGRKKSLPVLWRYYSILLERLRRTSTCISIIRYSKNTRAQRFGNWICFRPQVRGIETPNLLDPLEKGLRLALSKGPNKVGVSSPHLRTETDTFSETLCFLVSRIPDDGQSKKTK